MIRALARAAAVALFGAIAGALFLIIATNRESGVWLEMDRESSQVLSGVYPPERVDNLTFAWTGSRAQLVLDGLDRGSQWRCTVRFRGGRPEPLQQPTVRVAVDGLSAASREATNEFQNIEVSVPPRDRDGLVLTIDISSTLVPGPHDRRDLGVQLDRLGCGPEGEAFVVPARRALLYASLAAGVLGAALSLINLVAVSAVGAAVLLAGAQAVPLSAGPAPYTAFGEFALRLALAVAVVMVGTTLLLQHVTRRRLRNTARFVIAFSAAALYLQLLALLHPSKTIVDAVFHAHRFELVLSGQFLFTQAMGSGVQFPYAIGLYVFAAPFSLLTSDYVTLLRVVTCTAEIVVGTLVYVTVVRIWADRLAGAIAAGLFSLVPMKYLFIGSANLTNVFGQSIALAAMAAVMTLSLRPRRLRDLMLLFVLTAWAFLCHISTAATLMTTMTATAALFWLFGGPALRAPGRRTLAVTVAAALLSILVYYGHFGPVYAKALRLRTQAAAAAPENLRSPDPQEPTGAAARYRTFTPLPVRLRDAAVLTVRSVGWPILVLACVGARRVWMRGVPDRLALAVVAWSVTYCLFLGVALMRVDTSYQRYSYEFVGRLTYATYPAAIVLAGVGAAWAWRAGRAGRAASVALLGVAVIVGIQSWLSWLH